jgi:predicted nucleic acid-binding protein
MLVYLDTAIVIYFVEQVPQFFPLVQQRLNDLHNAGDQPALSDLTELECLVQPLRQNNAVVEADFETFFALANIVHVPLTSAVYRRAARIRAVHRFQLADSLHLAAAIEGGCGLFLTNDHRLRVFPDIPIEVLT